MRVVVRNAQREAPVPVDRLARLARRAVRRLRLDGGGTLAITFIGARRLRALNRRFLRHDWMTDVLSFRYDGAPAGSGRAAVVGEVLIAPHAARAYARAHGIRYRDELARYVVHGLLHWRGQDDRTAAQQRRMRALEDDLLARCGHP